jgi:hypothetical protein
VIIPRVSVTLFAALVLDCGSDVPYAYFERQRVLLVHAAQLIHERGHVPHGVVRKALHAHELPVAGLREAGDHACLDSVKVSHALLRLLPSGTVSATRWYTWDAVTVGVDGGVGNGSVSRPAGAMNP